MSFLEMPSDPSESWWPYILSFIIGAITIFRKFIGGMQCPNSVRLDGKIVIVTGASSGIGFETAKELAKRGGHIIMCTRDLHKGVKAMNMIKSKVPKAKLTLKKLDLCSTESVFNLVKCLENIRVDILINNAGLCSHPYRLTDDGHEIHIATNYLGHFQLTHLLLENLKMSEQGRIVNVTAGNVRPISMPLSCAPAKEIFSAREWFAQSKMALTLMTKIFTVLLKDTNITINCMNPGLVRGTEHNRHSMLVKHWGARMFLLPWMWLFMKTPMQGAQTAVFLATDPSLSKISGKLFNLGNLNAEIRPFVIYLFPQFIFSKADWFLGLNTKYLAAYDARNVPGIDRVNCSEEKIEGEADSMEEAKKLYLKTCNLLKIKLIEHSKKP